MRHVAKHPIKRFSKKQLELHKSQVCRAGPGPPPLPSPAKHGVAGENGARGRTSGGDVLDAGYLGGDEVVSHVGREEPHVVRRAGA